MINTVEQFLDENNLLNNENTFLVGFSGGCDSLCLLDILITLSKKYHFKVVAMHLNHNWRKEESLQEEQNCREYCKKNDLDCIIEVLDETSQKTENFARDARYAFFLKVAKKYKNSCLFTGHTSSDNAETIVYRIIKGTGVVGLKGIPAKRTLGEIDVYRPLLGLSRQQTEDYCYSKGLTPNNDTSNYDTNYKRNFIRHKIMPLFKEINYNAEKSLNSLSQMAISQSNIVDEYINIIKKDVYIDGKVLTQKFKLLSDDVKKKFIYNACQKFNIDYDTKRISNILNFMKENFDSKAGSRYSITNDLWLFVNNKYIYLINAPCAEKSDKELSISSEGKWLFDCNISLTIDRYLSEENPVYPKETESYAYVDLTNVGFDLTFRTRRDGDFISPFGMNGTMKLKKYLNSKGISQHEKDNLLLLCKGSEVLWVVGVGLSNKLKVVNHPTHVLRLEKERRGI